MKRMLKIFLYGFVVCSVVAGAFCYRIHRLQEGIAGRILRFHVIANSDSRGDQELKLKVRDRIGEFLGGELDGVMDLEECEDVVTGYLGEIEKCAKDVISEEGFDYGVRAMVQDSEFPEKTYGSFTFPGGVYRALRVVIGDGDGKKWWCVMYPNLCFANSVYEVVDEESDEKLRAALTKEDYEEMLAEGKLRVGFKYLGLFR